MDGYGNVNGWHCYSSTVLFINLFRFHGFVICLFCYQKHCREARYSLIDDHTTSDEVPINVSLDPFHVAYLMVDDGTSREYNHEPKIRKKFEDYIKDEIQFPGANTCRPTLLKHLVNMYVDVNRSKHFWEQLCCLLLLLHHRLNIIDTSTATTISTAWNCVLFYHCYTSLPWLQMWRPHSSSLLWVETSSRCRKWETPLPNRYQWLLWTEVVLLLICWLIFTQKWNTVNQGRYGMSYSRIKTETVAYILHSGLIIINNVANVFIQWTAICIHHTTLYVVPWLMNWTYQEFRSTSFSAVVVNNISFCTIISSSDEILGLPKYKRIAASDKQCIEKIMQERHLVGKFGALGKCSAEYFMKRFFLDSSYNYQLHSRFKYLDCQKMTTKTWTMQFCWPVFQVIQ